MAALSRPVLARIRLGPGFFSCPRTNDPRRGMRTGVSREFRELPPAPIVCLSDVPIAVPFVSGCDRAPYRSKANMIVVLMVIEILLATSAQLLLRQGAMKLGHDELTFAIALEPFRNVFVLAGLMLHALSFFLYVFILSKLQLNVLYPIATGATIVLVTGFSAFFFRESLTISQGAGMLAILVGIMLVYLTS